jgi:ribonuclease BN (tRNA processing enzyme)
METKLVLLGTGTPNACPNASGPASAVVVGDRAYLVDFGPGVVRQASKAYFNGIDALRPDRLTVAFSTHLYTDHTAGYPDLIFTPWVLERTVPLKVFGPKGLKHMTEHILMAYETDIDFRIHGFEKANEQGYQVDVTEIEEDKYNVKIKGNLNWDWCHFNGGSNGCIAHNIETFINDYTRKLDELVKFFK